MIFLDLLKNIALLTSLSFVHNLIVRHWKRNLLIYQILSGLLFGGVAVIGMITPLKLAPGIIFDGRSIVLSVAGLFGGPATAAVAAVVAIAYRLWIGGAGAFVGSAVVVESSCLGLMYYLLRRRYPLQAVRPWYLFGFGLLVHLGMLALMLELPGGVSRQVLNQIALPVLTIYPLATVLVGMLFLSQESQLVAEAALRESEERYRSLFEHNHSVMLLVDPDSGVIVDANPAACRYYGWSRAEMRTMSINQINTLTTEQIHAEMQLARAEKCNHFFFKHRLADGTCRDVEVFSGPIRLSGHNLLYSITFDITERKQAEEALRERTEELNHYFTIALDLLCIADTDGYFRRLNKQWEVTLGYPLAELEGRRFLDFVHPDDLSATYEAISRLDAQESVLNFTNRYRCKDGSYRWIEWRSSPTGKRIYSAARDITERKQAEEQRLGLERQLLQAQKMESLGILAGGVAHDFNNLLTAILGNLELALFDLSAGSSVRPVIQEASQAARRAAALTQQLLAYAGKGQFFITDLNLSTLVEEYAPMLKAGITKTVTLALQLDGDIPSIPADVSQVQHVITNLVTNACEAIGGRPGTVTLSTGTMLCDEKYLSRSRTEEKPAPGRFAWLEVADTGCGMDAETQRRLFDPFFTTKFVGRGLGMPAVLGIVRGHKGAILVDSAVDQGSRIRVLLPVSKAATTVPPEVALGSGGAERS